MTEHAQDQEGAQGGGHGHAEPNYFGVIIALTVLTVVELAVVFMPLSRFAIGAMLVILAFTKAIIVAMYFMHLKFEKRTLAIIAGTPIVLCIMLLFALLPDSDPAKVKKPATATPAPASAPHS